jgi:hypothetical protein
MAHKYNFQVFPSMETVSVWAEDIDDAYGEMDCYAREWQNGVDGYEFLDDAHDIDDF